MLRQLFISGAVAACNKDVLIAPRERCRIRHCPFNEQGQ